MKNQIGVALLIVFIFSTLNGCDDSSDNITDIELDSDDPLNYSWIIRNGATGYNGEPANVESISVTDEHVIINSSGIPSYDIGQPNGWPDGNPSTPAAHDNTFYILREPSIESGTKTSTPLGNIAVLTNGVPLFNALDAFSFNNLGIWNRNAHYWEGDGMDSCNGHPAPGRTLQDGNYHHHFYPVCLLNEHYSSFDNTQHSPIIGWAFDGFPIYGPFGYSDMDGSNGVFRMKSGYQLRDITQRQILPDGSQLSESDYGPDVSNSFPLGAYLEDYEYVVDSGHLDEFNGHITFTPDYPNGIYHYHVTINESEDDGVYPFFIGPTYYGEVETLNFSQ